MLYITLVFLFLSILFYLTFGGADFGVGILEFFSAKKNKAITKRVAYRVIGPVWEANHVWIIICIVIGWIAFPYYYNLIVTQLHIPLSLLLVGIIGRGTAFIFRHYDAYKDQSQLLYDKIFEYASLFTPFMIGITAGALMSGEMIHPNRVASTSFYDLYIHTWLNPFSILIGVFVMSLSAYAAAVFIIGETSNSSERMYYINKAKRANFSIILSGVLVFVEGFINNRVFTQLILDQPLVWFIMVFATSSILPLWWLIQKNAKMLSRIMVGAQMALILLLWVVIAYPNMIVFKSGELSMLEHLPPPSVFNVMGWSLIIASILVLPGLYHLFKTFGLVSK